MPSGRRCPRLLALLTAVSRQRAHVWSRVCRVRMLRQNFIYLVAAWSAPCSETTSPHGALDERPTSNVRKQQLLLWYTCIQVSICT